MEKKESKVCIIGAYFGKLPNYFEAWLLSCRYNPSIDFIVFVDDEVASVSDNVKVIKTTFQELKKIIKKKMEFETGLVSPYKLCDFKVAYGLIFEDYLKSYDYWGHCDFDMIFGDLRSFFDKYQLESYDKFLPLGHLTLYRNTKENNRRFMNQIEGQADYKRIFTDENNFVFDEIGINKIYYNSKEKFFDKIIFVDIYDKLSRYTQVTNVKYYKSIYDDYKRTKKINHKHQLFYWKEGKVFCSYIEKGNIETEEYIYIHTQKRKLVVFIDNNTKSFYLSKNQIMKRENTNITKKEIIEWNPYNSVQECSEKILYFIKHCWSYFKRRIIKIEKSTIIISK